MRISISRLDFIFLFMESETPSRVLSTEYTVFHLYCYNLSLGRPVTNKSKRPLCRTMRFDMPWTDIHSSAKNDMCMTYMLVIIHSIFSKHYFTLP